MSISKSKLVILFIGFFFTGVFTSHIFHLPYYYSLSLFILSLSLLILNKQYLIYVAAIFCLFAGSAYFYLYNLRVIPKQLPYGEKIEKEGMISEPPQIEEGTQKIVVLIDNGNNKYRLLSKVPLFPEYKYGDMVSISGKLEKPQNFDNFDYVSYLAARKIYATMNEPEKIQVTGSKGNFFYRQIFGLRNLLSEALNKILPQPHSALAEGLILGGRRSMPRNLQDSLSQTGTSHIVAISGFNITILLKVFYEYSTIILSRSLTFYFGALALLGFVIMTGASASVVRAAIMGGLFLLARHIGRRDKIATSLFLTALVMVLLNPYVLASDLGFQLSFLAVLGLIYLDPIIVRKITKVRFAKYLPKILPQTLSATVSAQIMVLPILLGSFGKISLISPLTNVLILPLVPVAMLFVFLAAVSGLFSLILGKAMALLAWVILHYMLSVINIFARFPVLQASSVSMDIYWTLFYYLILGWILVLYYRFNQLKASDNANP